MARMGKKAAGHLLDGRECPALYFDPLIIVGGDEQKTDPREPNYCTRCDVHHYLPAKEYTYLILKPLGEKAAAGDLQPLRTELGLIQSSMKQSRLYQHMTERYLDVKEPRPVMMNALKVACVAEKALSFLYAEQNLVSRQQVIELINALELDRDYLERRLRDNGRVL